MTSFVLFAIVLLTLSIQIKIISRRHFEIYSYFSQKTGFDILCKLSPMETICMEGQIMFSGKNKKKSSICRLLN